MSESVEWFNTKDAAARLGISLRSLYRFIDEGDLAAFKFGRVIRLKGADIDRFVESCRISPGDLDHLYFHPQPGDATEDDDDGEAV